MGVQKNVGPGQCAPTPRGAEPEAPRALLQGRGAAGGRAELAAAGRFSWECHFLAWSPGTFTGSCGVFGCFPRLGREAGREDELGSPPFWAPRKGRERGDRGGRGGRGDRAGLRGVLFPAPAVLPSDGWGEAKSKHPVPRPPSRLPFFPVLQILGSSSSGNAGRKLAREGGGGWKFLAALCLSVFGAEEVGGWVGGGVRGGGENALLAELLGGSGDNSLGSSGGNRRSRWRTRRPSCQLPAPPTAL